MTVLANSNPSRLAAVAALGQQIWLDQLSRSLVQSGELQRWVDDHAVAGVTSNPAIFAQALAKDAAYLDSLPGLRADEPDLERRFERLVLPDVQAACDVLRPVYERSGGAAGRVSFEVSPSLSRDSAGTVAAARRLWAVIDRPNAMIKIPATAEGLVAIRETLAAGISVNVTLMFSPAHARGVFEACLQGLQQRHAAGLPLAGVHCVASVFVSRVDGWCDARLPEAQAALRGQLGIANARRCHALWVETFGGEAFSALRAAGAHVPLCLWASTGTKNPAERDVRYVEALIGPDTVNTVPEATLRAFVDHGEAARTLDAQPEAAAEWLRRAEAAGLDFTAMGEELQAQGLRQFEAAFEQLMAAVA